MNGYIQITIPVDRAINKEIKKIDQVVGLKFNMYAAENISSIKGNPTSGANIVRMVWAGVIGNAFVKQQDPVVTFEEVADFVETLTLKGDEKNILEKVSNTFFEAEPVKILLEKVKEKTEEKGDEENESKKKELTGSTSTL